LLEPFLILHRPSALQISLTQCSPLLGVNAEQAFKHFRKRLSEAINDLYIGSTNFLLRAIRSVTMFLEVLVTLARTWFRRCPRIAFREYGMHDDSNGKGVTQKPVVFKATGVHLWRLVRYFRAWIFEVSLCRGHAEVDDAYFKFATLIRLQKDILKGKVAMNNTHIM
jgi:hypothetical protein